MIDLPNAAVTGLGVRLRSSEEHPLGQTRARESGTSPREDSSLDAAQGAEAIEPTQAGLDGSAESNAPSRQTSHRPLLEEIQAPRPAGTPMSGSFYLRHPKLTKVMGRMAALATFVSSVVPLTVAYGLATPARMFFLLAKAVFPSPAEKLLKNRYFKHLVGPFAEGSVSARNEATDNQIRAESGMSLLMDVASGGTLFSASNGALRAFELARRAQQKTNKQLGFSQVNKEAAGIQATEDIEVTAGVQATEGIEVTAGVQALDAKGRPLDQAVNQWFDVLGDETPKTGLDENALKSLENRFESPGTGASALSRLLDEMFKGMPTHFEATENPEVNKQRETDKENFKTFVNDRLLPVLTGIQNSEKVARNAFQLAETGLGAYSDLAVFGWMAVELGAQSTQYTEQYLQLDKTDKANGHKASTLLAKLLQVEAQKFTLNESKKHAGRLLQHNQRSKWMADPEQTDPGAKLDMVKCYLALCKKVQEKAPQSSIQWYPKIPYSLYASGLEENDLARGSDRIIKHVDRLWNARSNADLLNHLQSADSWQEVLESAYPHTNDQKTKQLKYCTDVLYHLDAIRDAVGEEDIGNAYKVAAEAVGLLYREFNGEAISLKGGNLRSDEFIEKQIRLCVPVFVKGHRYSEQTERVCEKFRELQSILTQMNADSPVFSEVLNNAKSSYGIPLEKPRFTAESLELICRDLGATKTKFEEMETKGKVSADVLRNLARDAIQKNNEELLHAIMLSPKMIDGHNTLRDSLPNLSKALGEISSQHKTVGAKKESERRTFTLAYINAFKKGIHRSPHQAMTTPHRPKQTPVL